MTLNENELEFLFTAWTRSGSPQKREERGFRVQMHTPEWRMAMSMAAKGLLSQPMRAHCSYIKRFLWLEPGILMMRAYFASMFQDASRPDPEPTIFRPGSKEKIAVLRERAAQGQNLWSKDDWMPMCGEAERIWKTWI